jgi:hypothetical protein
MAIDLVIFCLLSIVEGAVGYTPQSNVNERRMPTLHNG